MVNITIIIIIFKLYHFHFPNQFNTDDLSVLVYEITDILKLINLKKKKG